MPKNAKNPRTGSRGRDLAHKSPPISTRTRSHKDKSTFNASKDDIAISEESAKQSQSFYLTSMHSLQTLEDKIIYRGRQVQAKFDRADKSWAAGTKSTKDFFIEMHAYLKDSSELDTLYKDISDEIMRLSLDSFTVYLSVDGHSTFRPLI
ncbi:MAG: hypothetical protein M1812_001551 [Candelaria pacifica]|nr:MAG: hypothetical protein M1812_001551 [Candelaria pacifica]